MRVLFKSEVIEVSKVEINELGNGKIYPINKDEPIIDFHIGYVVLQDGTIVEDPMSGGEKRIRRKLILDELASSGYVDLRRFKAFSRSGRNMNAEE